MSNRFGPRRSLPNASVGRIIWLTLFCATLSMAANAGAQDCNVKAVVLRETPVFERPATQFNTAKGWAYDAPIAVLASNVTVFICAERTVWFGLISQDWANIAFWASGRWQHGWVVKQNLRAAALDPADLSLAGILQEVLSPSSAHAKPPVVGESPPPGVGPAPPSTASTSLGTLLDMEDSALASFYGILFLCMVLGMLGKVAFDSLANPGQFDWKARARAGILPLLFSPIVFLSIMKAADANATASLGSFIAFACTAFQNGFFWHTIIDRSGGLPKAAG